MNLTKKQVGALLKVMSKDTTRPVLCGVKVDKYLGKNVLVATDGYIMAVLGLGEIEAELSGNWIIRRDALERWYKLADGKSRLTERELLNVSRDDYTKNDGYLEGSYPDWQNMIMAKVISDRQPTESVKFNADYAKTLQDLSGDDGLEWSLGGTLGAMVAESNGNTYIMMPMKRK